VLCTPSELSAAIAQFYPRGAVRIPRVETEKIPQPVPVPKKTKPKKPPEPVQPMNVEDIKNRFWLSVATFDFAFAFVWFATYFLQMPKELYKAVPLAVIAGGLAAFVTWRKLSR
jgi:hypothetical protein